MRFHLRMYVQIQDVVDVLDTLLDERNDMSFEDISTQVHACIYFVVCCDIFEFF